MATYCLVYKGGPGMAMSEAEQQAEMEKWGAWYGSLGDAVVDGGNPFGASAGVATDGSVTQGGASGLTGYTMLAADSLDAATAMAKGCPVLSSKGTVEVYEIVPVM